MDYCVGVTGPLCSLLQWDYIDKSLLFITTISTYVCVHMCGVCISDMYVFTCVCVRLSVCVCMCMSVHVYACVCLCVGICMISYTCVYMCMCVVYACAFIYVCMWKPEANDGCLCQSTLFLRSGNLSTSLGCLASELQGSACLSSTSPRLGIDIQCYVWFYVGTGDQVFTWTVC